MPKKGGEDLDASAIDLWIQILIESEEADSPESAMLWLSDLEKNNLDYYSSRLSVYRKSSGRICKTWECVVDVARVLERNIIASQRK